jgi:hypothetical protein
LQIIEMGADLDISWRQRLLPIAIGYASAIIVTVLLSEVIFWGIVREIYLFPPSDVTDLPSKVTESLLAALAMMTFYWIVYFIFTVLIAFALALPAAAAIIYAERHKIRAFWPHGLGGVLLAFVHGFVLLVARSVRLYIAFVFRFAQDETVLGFYFAGNDLRGTIRWLDILAHCRQTRGPCALFPHLNCC